MKTIILTDPDSRKILNTYGSDLIKKLENISDLVVYDKVECDFSNIPELFDDSEKILMFDPFSVENDFEDLTKILSKTKNIKYIFSPYSFYTGLDLELLKNLNIKYRNNAGANADAVSQFAITLMFMLLRKFPILSKQTKTPDGTILGEEIYSKSVGIIGMGNVGSELYNFFKNLNIDTKYYNRTDKNLDIERVDFDEIFNQDIIFVTIATTDATKYLLSKLPENLKENNYLIDITSTDELYDKHSVIKLLEQNKFRGYAFETPDTTLYTNHEDKNLIITPHIAWCTVEEETKMVRNYLTRAINVLEGNENQIDYLV